MFTPAPEAPKDEPEPVEPESEVSPTPEAPKKKKGRW